MENFKAAKERAGELDWHKEIDWDAPDRERQLSLFYAKTCDELKNRPGFQNVFGKLTEEFATTHPGAAGDKIYAEWMITRLRQAFSDTK